MGGSITLRNPHGLEVVVLLRGAIIQSLRVPDTDGNVEDVVLGFDEEAPYKDGTSPYMGALVGRVANRIAGAQFSLDGETYRLAANNGPNCLHGGKVGYDKVEWDMEPADSDEGQGVRLSYRSKDGEEARRRRARRACRCAVPHARRRVDDVSIPTGDIAPVRGTPFDFTSPHTVGERIEDVPGPAPGGYDHNYVLFGLGPDARDKPQLAATLVDPESGRGMHVLTTTPGVQFYSGNSLDGSLRGKGGATYNKHAGLCLETQGFPNAINQPNFPSVVLRPGEEYRHVLVYQFFNSTQ
ncbi:hypothetical protein CHLNCDRAFT_55668 [Chlorella variabilis]|uniref:Aldose 1-epimerase n=1 Tax=Chlorella variabilis TaxID=554065 RepID=E1ZU53_CHLVA|nr:hypothetical protein CHLNCDRAFT_55668 [Chlorella variabilis]EFN50643.1 hypothetical protein CHLNCDRAFT_55668 [Chlorella variabilis]|eukprot:XP_005852306.1 hypothetical protein CHLNCDRAFT_55668 [Chlorella variabilis]